MRACIHICWALALLLAPAAFAQRGKDGGGRMRARPSGPMAPRRNEPKAKEPEDQHQNRPIDRFMDMSPEERRKALDRLPPERRQRIEAQLERYNSLPAEERRMLRDRLEEFRHLPPDKQNQVRRSFREFTQLPEDRRRIVGHELKQLSSMPEAERRARINSEEFRSRYTPAERTMLDNLSGTVSPPD